MGGFVRLYQGRGKHYTTSGTYLCLDHATKSEVTSGKKGSRAGKYFLDAAFAFSR